MQMNRNKYANFSKIISPHCEKQLRLNPRWHTEHRGNLSVHSVLNFLMGYLKSGLIKFRKNKLGRYNILLGWILSECAGLFFRIKSSVFRRPERCDLVTVPLEGPKIWRGNQYSKSAEGKCFASKFVKIWGGDLPPPPLHGSDGPV